MSTQKKRYKGKLVLVAGNSGSGKDSIISGVSNRWKHSYPKLYVPQRYVTRPAHISENFISVTESAFCQMHTCGNFAIVWESYGLHYGVPRNIFEWLDEGHFVIVNVSRNVISQVRAEIPNTVVFFIQVPIGIIEQRILGRGRETPTDPQFHARLERAVQNQTLEEADFTVSNANDLEHAIQNFLSILYSWLP